MADTHETDELVERLRGFEGSDDLGNGDFSVCREAADRLASLEERERVLTEENARLKMEIAAIMRGELYAPDLDSGEPVSALESPHLKRRKFKAPHRPVSRS